MSAIARRLPRVHTASLASVLLWCRRVYDTLAEWQALATERADLAQLDDRLLADIGLTRRQQALECMKSPWGIILMGNHLPIRNRIDRTQNW
jgi:uncharacterized protein YjiS (DUF1127 family)